MGKFMFIEVRQTWSQLKILLFDDHMALGNVYNHSARQISHTQTEENGSSCLIEFFFKSFYLFILGEANLGRPHQLQAPC